MSTILFTSVTIADEKSPHNGKLTDILLDGNKIVSIGKGIGANADTVVDTSGCFFSQGWVDSLAFCGEPGEEWKESIESLTDAGAAGGFTQIAALCGSHPYPENASAISSILEKSRNAAAEILPIGTSTLGMDGFEMTEVHDMLHAGAKAFFDGDNPISNSGVKTRMMEYAAHSKAPLFLFPFDKNLSPGGSMHEGIESTRLGLKGIPAAAEVNALQTDIELATWLKTPLRIVRISSAKSVELIRKAKAHGIEIYASVPVLNLLFADSNLSEFDENYKVLPPLRTAQDRDSLIQGLLDGTLDAVCSNHVPQDSESKDVEFDYAAYGASTIQTAFSTLIEALGTKADAALIVKLLSSGPKCMLNINQNAIAEGTTGDFTIFSMDKSWTLNRASNKSKSVNNPLMNKTLKGLAIGTIRNGIWNQNKIWNATATKN